MTRVLIVDDDPVELRRVADLVTNAGYVPLLAPSGDTALGILGSDPDIGAVILDLVMPDRDGMAVMEALSRADIAVPVIAAANPAAPESIASALRRGAVDFIARPATAERLSVALRNALHRVELETLLLRGHAHRTGPLGLDDFVSRSPAMHRVPELLRRAGKSAPPVLVEGEAGTGKTLAARIIHAIGDRSARPFIIFDCASVPLHHLEPALFAPTAGALSRADGGTLLLRGLAELPPDLQARLLRVVESGAIEDANELVRRVNVRLIVASRSRLLTLARSGALREDLYYRLNVQPIYLPPLRDRPEDIAALAAHFTARSVAELQRSPLHLSPEALTLLSAHDWPHNIRELETALHQAVALAETDRLEPADFPRIVARLYGRGEALQQIATIPLPSAPIHVDAANPEPRHIRLEEQVPDRFIGADGEIAPLADLERELIVFALARYAGHMSRVARALGIGRSTLYRKLREYGLDEETQTRAA
jgi:DNA-binding NtrC family response regulator